MTFRRRCSGKVVLYAIATKNGTCNYIFEIELKHLNPASCNFLSCCGCNNNCSSNNNGCGCCYNNGCGCNNGICPTLGGASENPCYYNNCMQQNTDVTPITETNAVSFTKVITSFPIAGIILFITCGKMILKNVCGEV